ncbi:MAG: 5'-deoxynucleotidase [Clostridia bacterium]|nr:5'-deoxynucleotidase [Clostridia bacterium]MBR7136558.1 5'-deoxynucleotidase [Clostridia bacterium]
MENAFFPLVFRQKYIRRWGLMRNLTTETLAEHSFEVAVTAHALALIGNSLFGRSYDADRTATLALFHDAPEVFTGDLPTPIKYYSKDIRENYAAIERNAVDQLTSKITPDIRREYSDILSEGSRPADDELHVLVHAADKLCAYIKCIEEEKGGNSEFRSAKASIRASLDRIDLPELGWFIAHVLPSFECDLDELQNS